MSSFLLQHVEKVLKHRELEQKLADAKLEQATAILMEEKEKNQKERELVMYLWIMTV